MDQSSDIQENRYLKSENIRLKSENNAMRNYVERLQKTLSALVDLQKEIDSVTRESNIYLLIHQMVEAALSCVDSENGSLMLLDEDTGELVFVEVVGDANQRLINRRLPSAMPGIAAWVMENRQAKMVSDIGSITAAEDERQPLYRAGYQNDGLRAPAGWRSPAWGDRGDQHQIWTAV